MRNYRASPSYDEEIEDLKAWLHTFSKLPVVSLLKFFTIYHYLRKTRHKTRSIHCFLLT